MGIVKTLSFDDSRTAQQALIEAQDENLDGCEGLVVFAEYDDGDYTLITSNMDAKDLLWASERLRVIALYGQ